MLGVLFEMSVWEVFEQQQNTPMYTHHFSLVKADLSFLTLTLTGKFHWPLGPMNIGHHWLVFWPAMAELYSGD